VSSEGKRRLGMSKAASFRLNPPGRFSGPGKVEGCHVCVRLATFDLAMSLHTRPNQVNVAKVAKIASFLHILPGGPVPRCPSPAAHVPPDVSLQTRWSGVRVCARIWQPDWQPDPVLPCP
jgi:hypothetical protein